MDYSKAASTLVGKAFIVDEIRKSLREGALDEKPITNEYTYKTVCDRLLNLYRAAHSACVASPNSLTKKNSDIDRAIKQVVKLKDMSAQNTWTGYEYAIVQNFQRNIQAIKNLPSLLSTQPPEVFRKTIVDLILAITQDVPTQLEKSLRIHFGHDHPDFAQDYPIQWTDQMWADKTFIQFLTNQLYYETNADANGNGHYLRQRERLPLTDAEYAKLFQNLLIHEKLNPDCFVFYQSATNKLLGVYLFQDLMARFLKQTGNPFDVKSYGHPDIPYDENKKSLNAIPKTVRDVLSSMSGSSDGDTKEPYSKHLMSSSYSIFGGSEENSFRGYFQSNQQTNDMGAVFSYMYDTIAPGLDITTTDGSKNKYNAMIIDMFQNNYNWQTMSTPLKDGDVVGNLAFPTIVQFFIHKDIANDVVYWGGWLGRAINHRGTSNIKDMLDTFIYTNDNKLLDYYDNSTFQNKTKSSDGIKVPSSKATSPLSKLAVMDNGGDFDPSNFMSKQTQFSLQGKIGSSTEAYFNGTLSGQIKTYFHCLRPEQYRVLNQMRGNLIKLIQEDMGRALAEGKLSTTVTEAKAYKKFDILSRGSSSKKKEQAFIKSTLENQALPESAFVAHTSTPKLYERLRTLYKTYGNTIPTLQQFVGDINPILGTKKSEKDINGLRYLEFLTILALNTNDHNFIAHTLSSQLSNQEINLPIDTRSANKKERKLMILLLKEIAYVLLTRDDYARILGKFNALPMDPPHIKKHKDMCKVYLKTLVRNIVESTRIKGYTHKEESYYTEYESRKAAIDHILDTVTPLSKKDFDVLIEGATDARIQTENNLIDLATHLLWKPIV
ncbi:MAG: hypothetical protein K2X98_01655 [Alphaproteobacteria bacterium]|nr:hypothetical protein [Alphaproteobacteria bacterium]